MENIKLEIKLKTKLLSPTETPEFLKKKEKIVLNRTRIIRTGFSGIIYDKVKNAY